MLIFSFKLCLTNGQNAQVNFSTVCAHFLTKTTMLLNLMCFVVSGHRLIPLLHFIMQHKLNFRPFVLRRIGKAPRTVLPWLYWICNFHAGRIHHAHQPGFLQYEQCLQSSYRSCHFRNDTRRLKSTVDISTENYENISPNLQYYQGIKSSSNKMFASFVNW